MNDKQLGLWEGMARRDAAMALVDEHAPEDWKDRALEAVRRVALMNREFASDDVWATGLEQPREPRAIGPVMVKAAQRGYCRNAGRTRKSTIPVQHARPLAVYESCIYGLAPASGIREEAPDTANRVLVQSPAAGN